MGRTETYIYCFKIDEDEEVYALSVLEKGRNGDPYLVNQIEGSDVIDIYEQTTGREVED